MLANVVINYEICYNIQCETIDGEFGVEWWIVEIINKPEWYKDGGKVKIVDHTEFIPEEYLPVFSANPIENNIFRIQGLSEIIVLPEYNSANTCN